MLCYSWLWSGEGLRIAVGDLMVYTCGLIGTRWGSLQVMVAFGRGKERNRSEKHTVGELGGSRTLSTSSCTRGWGVVADRSRLGLPAAKIDSGQRERGPGC